MKRMVLQNRNTLKSKQALWKALHKSFYQLRVLCGKQAKLITCLHVNKITTAKLFTEVSIRCPSSWWWSQEVLCHCRFTAPAAQVTFCFRSRHQAQRYWAQWKATSPIVQAFNLDKNYIIKSLLKLKNDVAGTRLKKPQTNPNLK